MFKFKTKRRCKNCENKIKEIDKLFEIQPCDMSVDELSKMQSKLYDYFSISHFDKKALNLFREVERELTIREFNQPFETNGGNND